MLGAGRLRFGPGSSLAQAAAPEWNPVRTHPVEIGPQASRLIVGFRATGDNAVIKIDQARARRRRPSTSPRRKPPAADVAELRAAAPRSALAGSRQITPSMHVLFLQKTLYGADVDAALEQLRADPAVRVCRRRSSAAIRMRCPMIRCSCPTAHAPAASGTCRRRAPRHRDQRSTRTVAPMRSPPGPSPPAAPAR